MRARTIIALSPPNPHPPLTPNPHNSDITLYLYAVRKWVIGNPRCIRPPAYPSRNTLVPATQATRPWATSFSWLKNASRWPTRSRFTPFESFSNFSLPTTLDRLSFLSFLVILLAASKSANAVPISLKQSADEGPNSPILFL